MSPAASHHFSIAEHHVQIDFAPSRANSIRLLPSFAPFALDDCNDDPLIRLIVDDDLRPISKERRSRVSDFDTGNGHIIVDWVDGGESGYQYIVKDIDGASCCLLQANKDFSINHCALNGSYNMRSFGLNNALMLIYAFKTSYLNTLLIHASLVRECGYGYAFIAKSGTGKSTHTSLWLKHIEGCDLMNDDNPIVRIIDDQAYIYGSPWSGKTPCYRNEKARLGAIVRIDRATENSIEQLTATTAFASLLPACSTMKWDKSIFDNICTNITSVIKTCGIYILHCLPDKEAALICHQAISKAQR